jgi:hypothetical protein
MSLPEYAPLETTVNRACDDHGPGLMPESPALKTREDLESEIENLDGRLAELKDQLDELNLEPIRKAARELLDPCCTDDDPDAAFTSAFEFLMRAADVRDDYADNVHGSVAVRVLVEEFGVEKIRDWTRQIGREIARAG